jgi:hypothetical protein
VGSDSLALYDYKDFLFNADKKFLALPVTLSANTGSLRNYFDGSLFFSIEAEKLVLRNKVDHSDGGKYQLLDCEYIGLCYNSSVKRAIYIGNLLYTFSNKYIKVNSLDDFSLRQILKLIPDTDLDTSVEAMPDPVNDISLGNEDQSMEDLIPVGPSLPSAPEAPVDDIITPDPTIPEVSADDASVPDPTIPEVPADDDPDPTLDI